MLLAMNRQTTLSSLIGLWWLSIVFHAVCVNLVNRLSICCPWMYLFWRDVVPLGRPLRALSLALFVALWRSDKRLMVRTLQFNACSTSWCPCPAAFILPIACSRVQDWVIWCSITDLTTCESFASLIVKSSVGVARSIYSFNSVFINTSRDLLETKYLRTSKIMQYCKLFFFKYKNVIDVFILRFDNTPMITTFERYHSDFSTCDQYR